MVIFLLSLLACPAGGGKDSGGSGGGGCGGAPTITGIDANGCGSGTCTWTITASGEMGSVDMSLDQTGDPSGDCGPGKGGLNDCGEWHEEHTAFLVDGSSGACGEKKSIDLKVEDNFKNQQDNVSTLFDSNDELNELTVLVIITDSNGDYADCVVSGDEVSFFADQCTRELK